MKKGIDRDMVLFRAMTGGSHRMMHRDVFRRTIDRNMVNLGVVQIITDPRMGGLMEDGTEISRFNVTELAGYREIYGAEPPPQVVAVEREQAMRILFRSLDQRWKPESVAELVFRLMSLEGEDRTKVQRAVAANRQVWMQEDFSRPDNMGRQLRVAGELFARPQPDRDDDGAAILDFIVDAGREILWQKDGIDFKSDRLPKADRHARGLTISRRQYNKRFRLLGRMLDKLGRMQREQLKRSIVLASKSRLGARLTWDQFSFDVTTACFIAYYVARCNLRSIFTNSTQVRAFDEICDVLLQRCGRSEMTDWYAIAHVYPEPGVISHLSEMQRGDLLGRYFSVLSDCAGLLKELWADGGIDAEQMIVKRGNDSTTWNITAGAWNKIRQGWLSLLHAMDMDSLLDEMCPGKVMRLMAADVAYWHRRSGGAVHPDMLVWAELPRPWEVLAGDARCDRRMVAEVCERHGVKPKESGWLEFAPPPGPLARFEPTPNLVHGVVISSPELAVTLRKMGVFSGQGTRTDEQTEVLDIIDALVDRDAHVAEQEARPPGADRK